MGVKWVSNVGSKPWKFQFYFNEIKHLLAHLQVVFCHEMKSVNCMADALSDQGLETVFPSLLYF